MNKTAIVLAPHADDESLGCGGTLLRLKYCDWKVHIILIFKGKDWQDREKEFEAAGKILGVFSHRVLGIEAGMIAAIEHYIDEVFMFSVSSGASVLFAPHPAEVDKEHLVANELANQVMAKYRFSGIDPCPALLEYEVWDTISRPDIMVNISNVEGGKRKAIRAYKSQLKTKDYEKAILSLNAYRGIMYADIENQYAEAFKVRKDHGGQSLSWFKESICTP